MRASEVPVLTIRFGGRAVTASSSWHALALPEVCERLSATPAGLVVAEARRRLLAIGRNELGHVHFGCRRGRCCLPSFKTFSS